jgi:hypothetical protein
MALEGSKAWMIQLLKRDRGEWNAWRRSHPDPLDLSGVNLGGADLIGDPCLFDVNLKGSILRVAYLCGADLRNANLSRSDPRLPEPCGPERRKLVQGRA